MKYAILTIDPPLTGSQPHVLLRNIITELSTEHTLRLLTTSAWTRTGESLPCKVEPERVSVCQELLPLIDEFKQDLPISVPDEVFFLLEGKTLTEPLDFLFIYGNEDNLLTKQIYKFCDLFCISVANLADNTTWKLIVDKMQHNQFSKLLDEELVNKPVSLPMVLTLQRYRL